MNQSNQEQKLKTFQVIHLENWHNDYTESYDNGTIEAIDLDQAVEQFKRDWINEKYKDDITEIDSDEISISLSLGIDYFLNGEELTKEQIEELEQKYNCDINDMIDNFNDEFKDLDIGTCEHMYQIIEVDSE